MTTNNLDNYIILSLNQLASRSEIFDRLMLDMADSALLKGALFMAYFWYLWFRRDGDVTRRRRIVVASLIGAIIAAIVARSLQLALPIHDRPLHDAALNFVLPTGVNPDTLAHWNSFPSDHAMLFFALSAAVAAHSRLLGALASIWTLAVICLPRVYLGYHYPSDIVVGAGLGILVMVATHRLIGNSTLVRRIVGWEQSNARIFYGLAFLVTYELAFLFYDVRSLGADGYHLFRSVVLALA
jgi:undecaprenyl-diphosphatase